MNQLILLNPKAFSGKIRTKLDKYFGKTIREVLAQRINFAQVFRIYFFNSA